MHFQSEGRRSETRSISKRGRAGRHEGGFQGNIWASGPAGIWVFSPEGRNLGAIKMPEIPANCNWGDDWKSLYITARTSLYRIKVAVEGEKQIYP